MKRYTIVFAITIFVLLVVVLNKTTVVGPKVVYSSSLQAKAGLLGDINNDNNVNIYDLMIVIRHFGRYKNIDPNYNQTVDLNTDDKVNVYDIVVLFKNFGSGDHISAPVINPVSGEYNNSVIINITSATDSIIMYTLNGDIPNLNSIIYKNPITITENTTIKARAFSNNSKPSSIATANYVIRNVSFQISAFPGAEGYGAGSIGGRGGTIYEITSLANSGAGTLRKCVEATGPRVCVFRIGGEIIMTTGRLKLDDGRITIAGQTAPGDGITIRRPNEQISSRLIGIGEKNTQPHDITIRYLKLRKGNGSQADNIQMRSGHNIIFDHLSLQWSTDEQIGVNPYPGTTVSNVTLQRSLIAEALRPHSVAILLVSFPNESIDHFSMHHNLFAHNAHRNPRSGRVQKVKFVNNLVYNWHSRVGTTLADTDIDFIGNYFKAGPWSSLINYIRHEHANYYNSSEIYPPPSIYITDNIALPLQPNPQDDNWNLVTYHYFLTGTLPPEWRRHTPLPEARYPITFESSNATYESVLNDVGDNARLDCVGNWVARQDIIDTDVINHVRTGTGPTVESEVDHQDDFGGYPSMDPGTPCIDSDHDGMPDDFENLYNLNPNDPSDNWEDADNDGWPNLEEFLSGSDPLS